MVEDGASWWFRCQVTVVVVAHFLAVKLRTVDNGDAPFNLCHHTHHEARWTNKD
ncbi:hypothetical protein BVRB_5g126160 [Beta vulgaris subsp. vulgaris]|uniref:Uncharacterized protein n=1 Tax=Beta vulgaris subsp. vulgaris TaxID=3555 RepID=A0A0J8BBY4_BETVV|nr:hypothetical protein BVRB_5g126160 [Beta vulgaris subsp. vulgaris]